MPAKPMIVRSSTLRMDEERLIKSSSGCPTWIYGMVILLMYLCYHGASAVQDEMHKERQEIEDGIQCLLKYKAADCNPLQLNKDCAMLVECIQNSEEDLDEWRILASTFKNTGESMSSTLLGPVALMISLILAYYLQREA